MAVLAEKLLYDKPPRAAWGASILKSELGLRPIYHHKKDRAEGHLFING